VWSHQPENPPGGVEGSADQSMKKTILVLFNYPLKALMLEASIPPAGPGDFIY